MSHDDCDSSARLKKLPASDASPSTSGWIDLNASDDTDDPLGTGPTADALRAVLDVADQVIMPIETEPLNSSKPTGGRWRTPVVRHDNLHSRASADG
jgi:chromosome partitioning protein